MWIQDFCTNCDKQCVSGSVYCSDACRLNDERNRPSDSQSPNSCSVSSPSPASSVDALTDGLNSWVQRRKDANISASYSSTKSKQNSSVGSAPQHHGSATPNELRLMYQSPMLRPANSMTSSPPVSPLLTAASADPVPVVSLSSSAYSSWLRR